MVLCLVAGVSFEPLSAQAYRGWATTSVRAVELRPVRLSSDGCLGTVPCYLPLDEEMSVTGTQDLSLTAFGFGVRGLSATTLVRGRWAVAGDFAWPRSDDRFDALLAYAQWTGSGWTARVGRQEARSGLGFASFDGAALTRQLLRPRRLPGSAFSPSVDVDVYGGRSLARGLRDPASDALAGFEDFVPDAGVWLMGGAVRLRATHGSASLRYQRELLSDRSGLASERAAVAASATLPFASMVSGLDWDFAQSRIGKAHLTLSRPVAGASWFVSASGRRYVPYFSLSTIWGFFEPVPYHEVEGRVAYSGAGRGSAWFSGGWRRYGDTGTAVVLRPLEGTGWRARVGGGWAFDRTWRVDSTYQLEWGPGGFLSSLDASLAGQVTSRVSGTVTATSFQQIEQYRLGDGRAVGAGTTIDIRLTDRFDLAAGALLLRHRGGGVAGASSAVGSAGDDVWNQARLWSTIRARLGSEPGRRTRVRR